LFSNFVFCHHFACDQFDFVDDQITSEANAVFAGGLPQNFEDISRMLRCFQNPWECDGKDSQQNGAFKDMGMLL